VYNYADKPDLASKDVIAQVYGALGRKAPRMHLPLPPIMLAAKPFDLLTRLTGKDLPITSARVEKLSEAETAFAADRIREVGYTAQHSLTAGITAMVQWYLREGRHAQPVVHLAPADVQVEPSAYPAAASEALRLGVHPRDPGIPRCRTRRPPGGRGLVRGSPQRPFGHRWGQRPARAPGHRPAAAPGRGCSGAVRASIAVSAQVDRTGAPIVAAGAPQPGAGPGRVRTRGGSRRPRRPAQLPGCEPQTGAGLRPDHIRSGQRIPRSAPRGRIALRPGRAAGARAARHVAHRTQRRGHAGSVHPPAARKRPRGGRGRHRGVSTADRS